MRVAIAAGLLSLALLAGTAGAAKQAGPRCAVKNNTPLVEKGRGGHEYLVGVFRNRCLDPVTKMGTFACLQEREVDDKVVRLIECHANEDFLPSTGIVPHETNVFMKAVCDYTTIARYYSISGYGWAISLPTDGAKKYQSQSMASPANVYGMADTGSQTKKYCHISAKNTFWRNESFG